MAQEFVYHYAHTANLPWILECGELRPGPNTIGGYPLDFLWATTDPRGSRSSSALANKNRDAWRRGSTRVVRFTLPAEAFTTWPEIVKRYPQWTPDHIDRLVSSAQRLGDTDVGAWRCRAEPLRLERDVQIHTRAYVGGWRPLEERAPVLVQGRDAMRGILIDDIVYLAERQSMQSGATAYTLFTPMRYADFVKAAGAGAVCEINRSGTS